MPGDSAAVIKQKAEARQRANQGMIQSAGKAFVQPEMPSAQTPGDLAAQARAELERRRRGQ
jgi:hypothetical protein